LAQTARGRLRNGTEPGRDPKLKGDDVDTKLEAAIVAGTTVFTTQVCAACPLVELARR